MIRTLFIFLLTTGITAILPAQDTLKQYRSMDEFVYPFTTHYADLPGNIRLAYSDEGQGPQTLVMIHGLGSYLPVWKKMVDSLRTDYRCIAIDLPNYGKSSRGDYPFTMSFFASTITQLLDSLGLNKVVLVGHSMGGQIAITLALKQPERVAALVLLAPAGFETFSEAERIWFGQVMTPELVKATPVPQIERNFAINFFGGQFPEDARFMYQDRLLMRETGPEYDTYCRMIPRCVQGMLNEPVFEQLPAIQAPTLVAYGAGDLLIPNRLLHPALTTEEVAKAGQSRIPDSRLVLLENCGHFVPWEGAGLIAAAIRELLNP